mmetsp:Transcript_39548/g.90820  ORF Transcript_39548/g.90820 Transcript_39548/m.90820 type:complete len:126 (+) Transcript_39548:225-602(+)
MLLEHGLYFIGDVKTNSKRFPRDALSDATQHENGSWAVMTTTVRVSSGCKQLYAVSHRRSESIHGFIASCGTTLAGNAHMAYFEDDEERAMGEIADFELARKCPSVLNDFTLAQPTIDRHNRYRQ